jgi:hypothetical protein
MHVLRFLEGPRKRVRRSDVGRKKRAARMQRTMEMPWNAFFPLYSLVRMRSLHAKCIISLLRSASSRNNEKIHQKNAQRAEQVEAPLIVGSGRIKPRETFHRTSDCQNDISRAGVGRGSDLMRGELTSSSDNVARAAQDRMRNGEIIKISPLRFH